MTLARWFTLIGVVVGLGCLRVTERNAMALKGYALGARMQAVHERETAVSWMDAEVLGLSSPRHLAQVAEQRKLKLVAWSALPPASPLVRVAELPDD